MSTPFSLLTNQVAVIQFSRMKIDRWWEYHFYQAKTHCNKFPENSQGRKILRFFTEKTDFQN